MIYSVLLSNGSLVKHNGLAPEIGSNVTAILKDQNGSFETVKAEVLAIWEDKK